MAAGPSDLPRHVIPPDRRERRSRVRVDVLGQIAAHCVARLRPLHLRELSTTGFSLESTGPFEYGVFHSFRIGVDGTSHSVVVRAVTRHCAISAMCGDLTIYVTGFEICPTDGGTLADVRALVQFADGLWDWP